MKIEPNSFEFNLFLTLIIILLIFKLSLVLYLSVEVNRQKKKTGEISFDFLFSILILFICLFISRILYLFFDFFLTEFDTSKAHLEPAITVWKFASLFANIGYIVVLFTIDKKVLSFKLKGILAYIMAIGAIIQFVYPVSSPEDFEVVSTIGALANIVAITIPIIFFYIGIKTPGLRKISFCIAFGVIIFAIGSNLAVEPILAPVRAAYGVTGQITMYFLLFTFKIIGLAMFTYGVINFKVGT